MDRLDVYEAMPAGMREYLSSHGWYFSKSLADFAVSKMENASNNKHYTHEQVMDIIQRAGVNIEKAKGYDAYYLFNMYFSDFFPEVLENEVKVAKAVSKNINDMDGYQGIALTRYYADTIGKGEPIEWEKFI